jgi:hypothetical protein
MRVCATPSTPLEVKHARCITCAVAGRGASKLANGSLCILLTFESTAWEQVILESNDICSVACQDIRPYCKNLFDEKRTMSLPCSNKGDAPYFAPDRLSTLLVRS